MNLRQILPLCGAAAGAVLMAGCGLRQGPPPPVAPPPMFMALGINAPYLNADIIGGTKARAAKMRAAKIRPLSAGAAPAYMSETANELRRQTAGIGIDVLNLSNGVVIRIPATLTFNSGSATIAPQIRATLRELARTIKTRNQTYVDVYAHTDTSGSPEVNKALSEKRASAVAAYFATDGVAKARIASRGYGESATLYPLEANETEKAANRRVEIRLVPYRG